ncbi:hypothetical protein CKAH01_17842 [Colletotrichum kahawae]|uniref:Aerolysin-like C-terminal domain-containing protein n=1 Tax=Colletotrichum kahawae TaxID=34407 RepID=A0AAD9YA17_COLKA|nr:hypothetical protein CKAH01_17842 [Colletotrichum kahawae]
MPAASFPWFGMNETAQKDSTGKGSSSNSAALKIDNGANDLIGTIKGPLNLITILGAARSGKSTSKFTLHYKMRLITIGTLLNCLAGSKSDLFQTSSGFLTFTKGVLMTTETFTLPQFSSMDGASPVDGDRSDLKVSIIDTEGQDAVGTLYDVNLFSPVLLCAKVIIFNYKGGLLTDQILSQLGMMTGAGRRLRGSQQGSSNGAQGDAHREATNGTSPDDPSTGGTANAGPRFGHLVILFNRFQLNRNSNIDELRSGLLDPESASDPAAIQRNQIRKMLDESFTSISLNVLPDNGVKSAVVEEMANDETRFLTLQDFTPSYLAHFAEFRAGLSRILKTPHQIIPKTDLTGGDMADFVPRFLQAINTQEPLNVPTIFEASRNQALNLAFTKFQTDLRAHMDTYALKPATSTVDLRRICRRYDHICDALLTCGQTLDMDIDLVIANTMNRLSYMPNDILNKLREDALKASGPLKQVALDTNLEKIKGITAIELGLMTGPALTAKIKSDFSNDKLCTLSETDLNVSLDTFFTSVRTEYEALCTAYDPDCIPATYKDVFESRFKAEKEGTQSRYARAWSAWASAVTRDAVSTLNNELDNLAATTPVGDQKAWSAGTLSAVNKAKSNLNQHFNTDYLGPDIDDNLKKCNSAIDDASKIQTAAWENDAEKQKSQLDDTLDLAVGAYKFRLMASISDMTHQPKAMDLITPATEEKKILEEFIKISKLDSSISKNARMKFDLKTSEAATSYSKPYSDAMDTFDRYFDAQLSVRSKEWSEGYARSMAEIDIGTPSKGPLRTETLSAIKLAAEEKRLGEMVQDGQKAKLNQYDELVSLYNRALLNEKAFEAGAREFSSIEGLPSQQRRDEMWNNFRSRSYKNLCENVTEYGELADAKVLNGKDDMPAELQRKIIENVKNDCAYLALDLGFSYISGATFSGRVEDQGLKDGASAEDPSGAATRSFFLRNTSDARGWWDEYKTNMKFFAWKLEASDYVLGKPIYSEMKPEMMLTNVDPASSTPKQFNSTASITKSGTVSDSISRETSWGAKVGLDVKATVFGAEVVTKLEGSYNGKYATGHVGTIQNSFTVGGSSAIDLPLNAPCTVTQLGFDQKCTVPYTAKYKMVPKLELLGGFVKAGGGFLKRDYFEKNKATERVRKSFTYNHLDELRKEAEDDFGPWDWHRFTQQSGDNNQQHQKYLNDLANGDKYTFYVRGKWEGITSKRVITTVTPHSSSVDLLPPGESSL